MQAAQTNTSEIFSDLMLTPGMHRKDTFIKPKDKRQIKDQIYSLFSPM